MAITAQRETSSSDFSDALPCFIDFAYRSWAMVAAAEMVNPDTTARIVAKATAETNPSRTSPPRKWAVCNTTMLRPPARPPAAFW